jgi:hypothetical protein
VSIPVTFKEVYTSNSCNFNVNPNWTITQFMDSVKPHICREFNIIENNFEIVEAGQYTTGVRPEAVMPLIQDTITKMKHKWGTKLNVSFYVRKKDYVQPEITVNTIRQSSTSPFTIVIGDCPICLENVAVTSRHTCCHTICDRCHQHCLSVHYTICPICRQN